MFQTIVSNVFECLKLGYSIFKGKPFEFVEELFEKVQPGLSSYADEPKKVCVTHSFYQM